jgi:hypothetical protein
MQPSDRAENSEQNEWSHGFPVRSYKCGKSRKNPKNHQKSAENTFFPTFVILITSHWKAVESRATTHFAQNFQLYQMAAFETMSDKSF